MMLEAQAFLPLAFQFAMYNRHEFVRRVTNSPVPGYIWLHFIISMEFE